MENTLVNRVANSGLITLNLEDDFPTIEILEFDLKDYLFHGLILKEKDFRKALKELDWEVYRGRVICVFCSTDAIIPVWAFMLVSAYGAPISSDVFLGSKENYIMQHYRSTLSKRDYSQYDGERIVIKGCSQKPVPPSAYLELTRHLQPYAQSIMYGEPCSTVPIFKRPRKIIRK